MPTVRVLKPPPAPGGAKTTTLFVTARLVTTDGPVTVQIVPLLRLTLAVEVASVLIAPVKDEALALSVTTLPAVAFRRLLLPAFAVVLLKLTVAVDGSAKTRSPERALMVKLSKVATAFVAFLNSIAFPADVIVPPPVARMEAPTP